MINSINFITFSLQFFFNILQPIERDLKKINISNPHFSDTNHIKIKNRITQTLSFSNYTWYVKSGTATPGPNCWSPNNAYVDSIGRLHLKITFNTITQKWECAEVWTTESLGFGTYEWFVNGQIDKLDKNVVVGFFNYPALYTIPDATNEIDIEFAKWGVETNKGGNFTVWPAMLLSGYTNKTYHFKISLSNPKTTQRFIWSPSSVLFQTFKGWNIDDDSLISKRYFNKKNQTFLIPQTVEPVHLNLWLFKGMPPANNTPVEIIIDRFQKYE
jgi:hypothetical protein